MSAVVHRTVGTNGFGHFPSFRIMDELRKRGGKMIFLLLLLELYLPVVHTENW